MKIVKKLVRILGTNQNLKCSKGDYDLRAKIYYLRIYCNFRYRTDWPVYIFQPNRYITYGNISIIISRLSKKILSSAIKNTACRLQAGN